MFIEPLQTSGYDTAPFPETYSGILDNGGNQEGDCILTVAMEQLKENRAPIKPGKKTLEDVQVRRQTCV